MAKKRRSTPGHTKEPGATWKSSSADRSVCRLHIDLAGMRSEQWILLRSDAHHDNAHCNQALEREHLEEAKQRNAIVLDGGDLFCAMQGKWDRRKDQSQLRPEYQGNNYLDRLVDEAAEFYEPYVNNLAMLGVGNHESSILKHHETDLTERLVERLNLHTTNDHKIIRGGFSGWVQIKVKRAGASCRGINIKHHHGYGGGGPVTRGVIQTNRMAVYLPDADIVWTGHTHDSWVMPITRERITDMGGLYFDEQVHVKTSGYKAT
jgi:hypothetical protein